MDRALCLFIAFLLLITPPLMASSNPEKPSPQFQADAYEDLGLTVIESGDYILVGTPFADDNDRDIDVVVTASAIISSAIIGGAVSGVLYYLDHNGDDFVMWELLLHVAIGIGVGLTMLFTGIHLLLAQFGGPLYAYATELLASGLIETSVQAGIDAAFQADDELQGEISELDSNEMQCKEILFNTFSTRESNIVDILNDATVNAGIGEFPESDFPQLASNYALINSSGGRYEPDLNFFTLQKNFNYDEFIWPSASVTVIGEPITIDATAGILTDNNQLTPLGTSQLTIPAGNWYLYTNQGIPASTIQQYPEGADGFAIGIFTSVPTRNMNRRLLNYNDDYKTVKFKLNPYLINYELVPTYPQVYPGASFTARYQINNPNSIQADILLDSRWRNSDGVYGELEPFSYLVSVAPGASWYERPCTVPMNMVPDTYDHAWYLLWPNNSYITSSGYIDDSFEVLFGQNTWTYTFGGADYDGCNSVQQTNDGGYIMGGHTESYGAGYYDFWLVKTDANGNAEWTQTYGGADYDGCNSVQQTNDGGYIMGGLTHSYGQGNSDFWLVKTDANGNEELTQTYGGAEFDKCNSVQQANDGGYIMGGITESYGAGDIDFWLVRTDANGNEEWTQTYGGADNDQCYSVQQTNDGGFILGGYTESFGVDFYDILLVKADANGNEQWTQIIDGGDFDDCYSVHQTDDGGYILGGKQSFFGGGGGGANFWLIKTDTDGNEQWSQTYGGAASDVCYSVKQTSDGGYILGGYTYSFGAGDSDYWLVKTDADGNEQWSQTYGGAARDECTSIQKTSDGGYILGGFTLSFGAGNRDCWLVKTDANGNVD